MSLVYKILASHLLMTFLAPTAGSGADRVIWGALGEPVYLDTNYKLDNTIEDVRLRDNEGRSIKLRGDKQNYPDKYEIFDNGTLMIKSLTNRDSKKYTLDMFSYGGINVFETSFVLKIQERVSEPTVSWNCENKTLTCQVKNGTGTKLELSLNGNKVSNNTKIIMSKLNTKKTKFRCTASNNINNETKEGFFDCSEVVLDLSIIISISVVGAVAFLFVILLSIYISRRIKQTRQRNDDMGMQVQRVATNDRGQKPNLGPGSSPNPAAAQLPLPPGHRPQTPGHHPQIPGQRLRLPHPQQKMPLPPIPQGHQQKAPPLPKPRAQGKPPRPELA